MLFENLRKERRMRYAIILLLIVFVGCATNDREDRSDFWGEERVSNLPVMPKEPTEAEEIVYLFPFEMPLVTQIERFMEPKARICIFYIICENYNSQINLNALSKVVNNLKDVYKIDEIYIDKNMNFSNDDFSLRTILDKEEILEKISDENNYTAIILSDIEDKNEWLVKIKEWNFSKENKMAVIALRVSPW